MKDLDITIDDNNSIRILPVEKYTASQKLKGEATKFVSSTLTLYLTPNRNHSVQRPHKEHKRLDRRPLPGDRKGKT